MGYTFSDFMSGKSRSDVQARDVREKLGHTPGLGKQHIRPASVGYCVGGQCLSASRPGYIAPRKPPPRTPIWMFSRQSRRRMQWNIARRDHRQVHPAGTAFATLTYPGKWNADFRRWKKDLDNLRRAWDREYGKTEFVWKVEPQRRGAPHFHLMIYLPESITRDMRKYKNRRGYIRWRGENLTKARKWLSETWYRLVGSQDVRHLKAGTQMQIASSNASSRYAAKYIGKSCQFVDPETGEIILPGRFWGRRNRGILPVNEHSTITTWQGAMSIARQARRYIEHTQARQGKTTKFHRHNHPTFKYLVPWTIVRQILGASCHREILTNDPDLMRVSDELYNDRQKIFMPFANNLGENMRIPI